MSNPDTHPSELSKPDTLPVRFPLPRPIRQRVMHRLKRMNLMTMRLWRAPYRTSSYSDLLEYEYVQAPELVYVPQWVVKLRDNTGLLWALVTLPLMLALIAFSAVFGATVAGAMVATQTAARLKYERDTRRHDLLATTPHGGLGTDWGIALGVMRDNRRFSEVQSLFYVFCGALSVLTLLMALPVGNVDYVEGAPLFVFDHLGDAVGLGLLTFTLYVEYRQALMIGILLGIRTPSIVRDEADSRIIVPALFLALQLSIYALLGLLALVLWMALQLHSTMIISVIVCVILFTSREVILRSLWRDICFHLNTDDRALDRLLEDYHP